MNNSRPAEFELFNSARRRQPRDIESIARSVLVAQLGRWLGCWRLASSIDHEAIEDVGALVGASIHERADTDVYDLATRGGEPIDQEIAGAFLAGYWRARSPTVDLGEYANWLDRLPREGQAFAAVLHALCTAVRYHHREMPSDTRRPALARLVTVRQILRSTGLHPSVLVDLEELPS